MTGALNTQASEFPPDDPIEEQGPTGADEFRDIDLTETVVRTSADYSSVPNYDMQPIRESRSEAVASRRNYADNGRVVSAEVVSELGTRRYGEFSATAQPGTGGYAGAPVLLLGEDRSRVRSVLSNAHATDSVRIGSLSNTQNGGGFSLPPGVLFETNTTEPIYACVPIPVNADEQTPIQVGVWAEYA